MATVIHPRDLLPDDMKSELPAGVSPAAATSKVPGTLRIVVGLVAIGVTFIAALIADGVFDDDSFVAGAGNTPVDGMTIFAVFFVAATAIERLLEPFAGALFPKGDLVEDATKKAKIAREVCRDAADPNKPTDEEEANTRVQTAAEGWQAVSDREWWRKATFWFIATLVAIFSAAALKLYFLGTVGIASANRWEEILATGLIIGAGTKPLHDLTELISAKKSDAKM
jgi:hypothetical protein